MSRTMSRDAFSGQHLGELILVLGSAAERDLTGNLAAVERALNRAWRALPAAG